MTTIVYQAKEMRKNLPNTKDTTKGFTLVELMVVIAIIAILAVAGLVLFTTATKNARDSKRRADVDAIAKAIEQNANPVGTPKYSAVTSSWFQNGIPADPGNFSYTYPTTTGSQYTVCSELESGYGNSSIAGGPSTNNAGNYTTPASTVYYYCLSNQQ